MPEINEDNPAIVYDVGRGIIDRSSQPRTLDVDIDVRDPGNKDGRTQWIYWGSSPNIKEAIKKAQKMLRSHKNWEVRFLNTKEFSIIKQVTVAEMLRLGEDIL